MYSNEITITILLCTILFIFRKEFINFFSISSKLGNINVSLGSLDEKLNLLSKKLDSVIEERKLNHDDMESNESVESWESDESVGEDEENSDWEPLKMVLCVRTDLQMGKGKIGAQCGHAVIGAFKRAMKFCPDDVKKWEIIGQKKIAVKVDSEEQILEIREKCRKAGLNAYVVADAGRTQIAAGSLTVLAIGPASESKFNGVTDDLKLL